MTTATGPRRNPASRTRHPSQHDWNCTGERWEIQPRLIRTGPLLARCANCSAVQIVRGDR